MKKTFLTIGLTALTTLGLLAGGVAIYNNRAPSGNKLTVSVGSDILFGKDDTSTQPDVAPVVELSELEKLAQEEKMMIILTLNEDSTIGSTYTVKEAYTASEKADIFNQILSNCGAHVDETTVHLGWSTSSDGDLVKSLEYSEGVMLLYPIYANTEDVVENMYSYLTNQGSAGAATTYYTGDEFSVEFWNYAPTTVDNLDFVGWVTTTDGNFPELTEENILSNEDVSTYVPETTTMFVAVYESKATGTLCTAQDITLTYFFASWGEGEYEQETYCNQEYYFHTPNADNKAGLAEFAKNLVPEQVPEGYEFAGWSTEHGNAEAIVDFETVDVSTIGDLFAIYTAIAE